MVTITLDMDAEERKAWDRLESSDPAEHDHSISELYREGVPIAEIAAQLHINRYRVRRRIDLMIDQGELKERLPLTKRKSEEHHRRWRQDYYEMNRERILANNRRWRERRKRG